MKNEKVESLSPDTVEEIVKATVSLFGIGWNSRKIIETLSRGDSYGARAYPEQIEAIVNVTYRQEIAASRKANAEFNREFKAVAARHFPELAGYSFNQLLNSLGQVSPSLGGKKASEALETLKKS